MPDPSGIAKTRLVDKARTEATAGIAGFHQNPIGQGPGSGAFFISRLRIAATCRRFPVFHGLSCCAGSKLERGALASRFLI